MTATVTQHDLAAEQAAKLGNFFGVRKTDELARASGETTRTVRFAWHCWAVDIDLKPFDDLRRKVRAEDVPGKVLRRMALIPLRSTTASVYGMLPRGGFVIGGWSGTHVIPAAASKAADGRAREGRRDVLSSEVAAVLFTALGQFGLTVPECLTAETEEAELAAHFLCHVIMNTPQPDGTVGNQIIMQDLDDWLGVVAPQALDRAISVGVEIGGEVVKLPAEQREQGLRLIADMRGGIRRATAHATAPTAGILSRSAAQIAGAAARQGDNKVGLDNLDKALQIQYPDFDITDAQRVYRLQKETFDAGRGGSPVAVGVDPLTIELSYWDSIKDSDDPLFFAAYLEEYPTGKFAKLARLKAKQVDEEKPKTARTKQAS